MANQYLQRLKLINLHPQHEAEDVLEYQEQFQIWVLQMMIKKINADSA